MNKLIQELEGGDFRSIGESNEIVQYVLDNPKEFKNLIDGLISSDPLIRMRSADAVEKITLKNPELLKPFKKEILEIVIKIEQKEVKWHFCQIIPRVELSKEEKKFVYGYLIKWVEDENESRIVRTFSIQAIFDLFKEDNPESVLKIFNKYLKSEIPSIRSRCNKLIKLI